MIMREIVTGRYESVDGYAGWIKGTRDDGTKWMLLIDEDGSPAEFYGTFDESGLPLVDPIDLAQYND